MVLKLQSNAKQIEWEGVRIDPREGEIEVSESQGGGKKVKSRMRV